jgi:hypothetical protein
MPKQRLPLALAAFLALLICSLHGNLGTVTGVRLYGAGSPNVASIFSAWNSAYLYSRDDVRYVTPPPSLSLWTLLLRRPAVR